MEKIKVYLNKDYKGGERKERRIVDAELLEVRQSTVLVRLPDNSIITRKKKRDIAESL